MRVLKNTMSMKSVPIAWTTPATAHDTVTIVSPNIVTDSRDCIAETTHDGDTRNDSSEIESRREKLFTVSAFSTAPTVMTMYGRMYPPQPSAMTIASRGMNTIGYCGVVDGSTTKTSATIQH